jgi:hypothetical protein
LLVQSNGGNTGADSEWWDANDTVPDCQPRAYHSSTFIQSTTMGIHSSNAARVWVFGGFNDDMGTISELQTLLVPQHNSSTSTNRSGGTGSSSNATEERMKKRMKMKTASSATNDAHYWTWESRVPDGDAPVGRFGHTTTVIGANMFLAGGTTGTSNFKGRVDGEELVNELWCLDLSVSSEHLHWERINVTGSPVGPPMQRCHSATAQGSKIIFFGGGPPGRTTRALHVLDTNTNAMNISLLEVQGGSSPRPRQNHVVTTMLDGSVMVLFGGCLARGNAEELGDTWVLDLDHGFKMLEGEAVTEEEEEEEEEEGDEEEEDNDLFNMYAGELIRVQFPDGSVRVIPRELFERLQQEHETGMSDGMSDEEEDEEEEEKEEREAKEQKE